MKTILISLILSISCGLQAQDSIAFHHVSTLPAIPRIEAAYFVIDSDFYVVGGGDSAYDFHREIWEYSIPTNSWHQMGNFPGGVMTNAAAFVIGGIAYLCGGIDSLSAYDKNSQTWAYNPTTDSWQRKADIPGRPRQGPSSFVFNGKGYVGMGTGTYGHDLWQYDPLTDSWSEMDSLHSMGRYGSAVVVVDSFAYFMGGYFVESIESTKEIWRYHILGNRWEQLNEIPGLTRGFSAVWVYQDKILISMGSHIDTNDFVSLLYDNYLFECSDSSWRSIVFKNFIDSTADGFSFSIGNTGYFFSGDKTVNPFSYYNDLWSFDATPLLATGIKPEIANNDFKVYPNPISPDNKLTISSPGEATLTFYNAIGQLLYTTSIQSGIDQIDCTQLHTHEGMIFYTAQFTNGNTTNGKLVILK